MSESDEAEREESSAVAEAGENAPSATLAEAEENAPSATLAEAEENAPSATLAEAEENAPSATLAEEAAAPDEAAPKKKKKAKKATEPEAPPIDDPRVREIETMFAVGDYARTREIAHELVTAKDPRLVDVGRDYLHRTGVDPIQIAFLGLCAAALIAIAWIYIPH